MTISGTAGGSDPAEIGQCHGPGRWPRRAPAPAAGAWSGVAAIRSGSVSAGIGVVSIQDG